MACFAINPVVQTLFDAKQSYILFVSWSSSQQADTTDLHELICDRYEALMTGISGIHQLLWPTDQRIRWLLISLNIVYLVVRICDGPRR